jgi:hypothetical protein
MLFSDRSIWTMIHGIGFGGSALLALAAVLFALYLLRSGRLPAADGEDIARTVARLTGFAALMLWLTSLAASSPRSRRCGACCSYPTLAPDFDSPWPKLATVGSGVNRDRQ